MNGCGEPGFIGNGGGFGTSPDLDEISGARNTREVDPIDKRDIKDGEIVDVENLADSSLHVEYFEMDHRQHWAIEVIMSNGVTTDDIQFWIDSALEAETDPSIITDWKDIVQDIFGTATITNVGGAVHFFIFVDTSVSANWFRARYQRIAGTANDGDIVVRTKRWY